MENSIFSYKQEAREFFIMENPSHNPPITMGVGNENTGEFTGVYITSDPLEDLRKSLSKYLDAKRQQLARPEDIYRFGDYCIIEQNRFGAENEHYVHKVIGMSKSNAWVDVPVVGSAVEVLHDTMEWVVSCICCGVQETTVLKYKLSDCKPNSRFVFPVPDRRASDNLNKADFWDHIYAKYPKATDHFCKWIDAYKEAQGWDNIFGSSIKFHDVPLAMQMGIFVTYYFDMYEGAPEFIVEAGDIDVDGLAQSLRHIFEIREYEINNPETFE